MGRGTLSASLWQGAGGVISMRTRALGKVGSLERLLGIAIVTGSFDRPPARELVRVRQVGYPRAPGRHQLPQALCGGCPHHQHARLHPHDAPAMVAEQIFWVLRNMHTEMNWKTVSRAN